MKKAHVLFQVSNILRALAAPFPCLLAPAVTPGSSSLEFLCVCWSLCLGCPPPTKYWHASPPPSLHPVLLWWQRGKPALRSPLTSLSRGRESTLHTGQRRLTGHQRWGLAHTWVSVTHCCSSWLVKSEVFHFQRLRLDPFTQNGLSFATHQPSYSCWFKLTAFHILNSSLSNLHKYLLSSWHMPGSVLGLGDISMSTKGIFLCPALLSEDGVLFLLCTQMWFIACLVRPSCGWAPGTYRRHYSKMLKNAFESTQDGLKNNNSNRHSLHSHQPSSFNPSGCLPFFGTWQTSFRPGSTTDLVTLNILPITLSFHFPLCKKAVSIASYLIRCLGGLSQVLHIGNLTK